MNISACITESFCCATETATTLLIKNTKIKKKKNRIKEQL